MDNGYAPQGTYNVGDRVVWMSAVAPRHNDRRGVVAKVIPYGDVLDLLFIQLDGDDTFVPAHSNDVFAEAEYDATVAAQEALV